LGAIGDLCEDLNTFAARAIINKKNALVLIKTNTYNYLFVDI
jgi:hypothetical protein